MRHQSTVQIVKRYRSILSGCLLQLYASSVESQNFGGMGCANGKNGEEDKYHHLKALATDGQGKDCQTCW